MRTLRRSLAVAAGASALMAGVPATASADKPSLRARYLQLYERVDRLGGDTGRNIVEHGVREGRLPRHGARRVRPATKREIRRSVRILRRMAAGLTAPAARAATAAAPAPAGSTAPAGLEAIAACESGGNPSAVSSDGRYRGKYQFDYQTWQSVGGTGDPAAAPEAEQDARAAALMARRGSSPWPVCG